ncbi:MAG: AI-2E family transporter [Caldilineaceae bacterium]
MQEPSRFLDEIPSELLSGMVNKQSRRQQSFDRMTSWDGESNRSYGSSGAGLRHISRKRPSSTEWSSGSQGRSGESSGSQGSGGQAGGSSTYWSPGGQTSQPIQRKSQQGKPAAAPTQFKRRDSVQHPQFGVGTVIESQLVGGDEEVTVAPPAWASKAGGIAGQPQEAVAMDSTPADGAPSKSPPSISRSTPAPTVSKFSSPPWNRTTKAIVASAALILLALATWRFRSLIAPIVSAIILAYLLGPAITFVQKQVNISRGKAVLIVYAVLILMLAGGGAAIALTSAQQVVTLFRTLPDLTVHAVERLQSYVIMVWNNDLSFGSYVFNPGQQIGQYNPDQTVRQIFNLLEPFASAAGPWPRDRADDGARVEPVAAGLRPLHLRGAGHAALRRHHL